MSLMDKASRGVNFMTRNNDIAMVVLLVLVVTLMIVPLPTWLVDTLIGVNMTLSFLLLMMAMYVKTALDFSSFPTMLLFTTLFRVGLNITTTRLILLQADAGEIIFTFGDFALGGNFVVGAVVWGKWMPDTYFGMTMTNEWFYSFLYNAPYMVPCIVICLVLILLLKKPLKTYFEAEDLKTA